jgi:hypothetical protein
MVKARLLTSSSQPHNLPVPDSGSPLVAHTGPALQLSVIGRDTPRFEMATRDDAAIGQHRPDRASVTSERGRRLGLSREAA